MKYINIILLYESFVVLCSDDFSLGMWEVEVGEFMLILG